MEALLYSTPSLAKKYGFFELTLIVLSAVAPAKTPFPMDRTVEGRDALFKDEQWEKALSPIDTTPSGSTSSSRELQL